MVRTVAIPERVLTSRLLDRVDYGDAFAADCPPDVLARYTPDELGELAMGRAPRWLRLFVRIAHRRMLGLRLTTARQHLSLGWDVLSSSAGEAVYGATGRLVTVRLLVVKDREQVLVVFLLRRERPWATPAVALVEPIHRAVVRYLLDRGTRIAVEECSQATLPDTHLHEEAPHRPPRPRPDRWATGAGPVLAGTGTSRRGH